MKRRAPREHIAETQRDPQVAAELTRNLRGHSEHSLVQWFGRNAMLAKQARVLAEAILNTPEAEMPKPKSALTKPGDPAQLRGIPVVGGRGSFGGAIKGTQPLAEVIAREQRRKRHSE